MVARLPSSTKLQRSWVLPALNDICLPCWSRTSVSCSPMVQTAYITNCLTGFLSRVKHRSVASCCSMTVTKQVLISKRYWLTSVKHVLCMVQRCPMGGRLSPLATDSLTEQVLTECCPTYVTERQCWNLRHTLMTGQGGHCETVLSQRL